MKKIALPFFVLALLSCFSSYPQNRGNQAFTSMPAPSLMQTIIKPGGGYSSGGLGGVGGVSFDATAHPGDGIVISSLAFSYDPSQPDGYRFLLEVNNKQIAVPLHDWLLIPIARYVNSGYNSCFTYFGALKDKSAEKVILDNDGHILNYHPAFFNTLLGLRLGDMDLLMMYEFVTDPPMENGKYILGAGEEMPDVSANESGYYRLIRHFNMAMDETGQQYRSYLISDYKQDIAFSFPSDTLIITGFPYYYCWKYVADDPDFDSEKEQNKITEKINGQITVKSEENGGSRRNAIIDLLLETVVEYNEGYRFYDAGTIVDLTKLPATGNQRRTLLEKYSTESLWEALVNTKVNMRFYDIVFLERLSNRMSDPDLIRSAIPHVWDATVNTMRYGAFFRYLRQNFPDQWDALIFSISSIKVTPSVKTPTVMYPKENSVIRTLIQARQ